MKTKLLLIIGALSLTTAFDQTTPKLIKSIPDGEIQTTGSFENGAKIVDLSWAWNSSVTCFPELQKHMLFETSIPKYSEMTITLIPSDKHAKLSLYS